MNPFDYRVSTIVYEERMQQAAQLRNLYSHGTNRSAADKRIITAIGPVTAWLGQFFKGNAPSSPVKTAAHSGQ